MKNEEKVLLYNFGDAARLAAIEDILTGLKIKFVEVMPEQDKHSVGHLFGLTGFGPNTKSVEEAFKFDYELMMFHNFTRPRLDKFLQAMREQQLDIPPCKAIVTPTNRFWSIRRVCQAMEKEHLAMKKQREQAKSE